MESKRNVGMFAVLYMQFYNKGLHKLWLLWDPLTATTQRTSALLPYGASMQHTAAAPAMSVSYSNVAFLEFDTKIFVR